MPLLPLKAVLAIDAVTDIALNARVTPIRSMALAKRLGLLEPVLQALVRHDIVKGTRGPRGGYQLAREERRITADDILRAAGTAVEMDCTPVAESALLKSVVLPVLREAEDAFSAELAQITVEDLAQSRAGFALATPGRNIRLYASVTQPKEGRWAPLRRKPTPGHKWPLRKLTPNAGCVALLVARLPLLLPVGPLLLLLPLGPPTLQVPVGGTSGLTLRAPKSAAICASRMSTPCAVMDSWSRVRNERRSP